MASTRMDLTSFVGKLLKEDDSDILREGIQSLAQVIGVCGPKTIVYSAYRWVLRRILDPDYDLVAMV